MPHKLAFRATFIHGGKVMTGSHTKVVKLLIFNYLYTFIKYLVQLPKHIQFFTISDQVLIHGRFNIQGIMIRMIPGGVILTDH